MSTEDELARDDAMTFADLHTPMALEPKPKPRATRRPKQDPMWAGSVKGYFKAKKLAERCNRKLAADQRKRDTAARKVQDAADAKAAKLLTAEEGHVLLPAVVLRDGTVKTVTAVDAVAIIEQYLEDLFLDCETSGYWVGHQHYELRTVQLGGEEMAVVLDAADEKQMQVASWALKGATRVWAHSAMADAIPCVVHGLITWDGIWGKMHDSVLKAKLTDPALCGSEADRLKDLARDILREYAVSPAAEVAKDELFRVMGATKKTDVLTPPEKNGWHQVRKTSVTMIRYAGSDVLDLAAVVRVLPPLPVPEEVMDRERVTQAMCARVAYEGVPLDLSHIRKKITEHETDQELSRRIVEHLTEGRLKNPASSGEVLAYLVEQGHEHYPLKVNRKTKKVTAGKESLEPIAKREPPDFPLARNIVDYRHDGTTLGLLLRPFENLCLHGDGRMRPFIYTINAKTGRMSAVRPNSQQLSRQGGVRACVKAPEGYLGLSADFEGCEIRVGAALSGDKALYEAEAGNQCHKCGEWSYEDEGQPCACGMGKSHLGLHWLTAHTAFGKDATKEHRYQAKRGTFTRLFGGGPDTAADQLGCDVSVMQKLFGAFNDVAPAFTAWDKWMKDCYNEGMTVWRDYTSPRVLFDQGYYNHLRATVGPSVAASYHQSTLGNYAQDIPGSSRHMVYKTYSGRNVYVTNGAHAAGNGAIQGTARELLVDGLIKWHDTRWGNSVCLPVHDQLIAFVKADEAIEATAELARCMSTDVLSSPGFSVHIGVDTDEPFVNWQDSS